MNPILGNTHEPAESTPAPFLCKYSFAFSKLLLTTTTYIQDIEYLGSVVFRTQFIIERMRRECSWHSWKLDCKVSKICSSAFLELKYNYLLCRLDEQQLQERYDNDSHWSFFVKSVTIYHCRSAQRCCVRKDCTFKVHTMSIPHIIWLCWLWNPITQYTIVLMYM